MSKDKTYPTIERRKNRLEVDGASDAAMRPMPPMKGDSLPNVLLWVFIAACIINLGYETIKSINHDEKDTQQSRQDSVKQTLTKTVQMRNASERQVQKMPGR